MAWVKTSALGCNYSSQHTPCARSGHTCQVYQDSMILFGGLDGEKSLNDLFILEIPSLVWRNPRILGTAPQPRHSHSSAVVGSDFYVYGGFNESGWLGCLVRLNLKNKIWEYPKATGQAPKAKEGHCMVAFGEAIYIQGGWNGDSLSEFHKLDTLKMEWETLPEGPKLYGHSVTLLEGKLYFFGGYDGSEWRSNLWVFETSWAKLEVKGFCKERTYHSCVSWGSEIFVFGGYDGKEVLGDLNVLDTQELCWRKEEFGEVMPRNAHTMVSYGSEFFLFGGFNGDTDAEDLYSLEAKALCKKEPINCLDSEDLRVVVGSKTFRVHKLVMAVRSRYFRAMLNSGMKESLSNTVELHGFSAESFESILNWVYHWKFVNFEDLESGLDLLVACNMLNLSLVSIVEVELCKLVGLENAVELYQTSHSINCLKLKRHCLSFILKELETLKNELHKLSQSALEELQKYLPKKAKKQESSSHKLQIEYPKLPLQYFIDKLSAPSKPLALNYCKSHSKKTKKKSHSKNYRKYRRVL